MKTRLEQVKNPDGTTTVMFGTEEKEPITYADILHAFKDQYPDEQVEDYRPADSIPYAILVWNKKEALLVQYQVSFGYVFILARQQIR